MANPYFQFKQFVIWHDKCGMKVGTDGVLLGSWAPVRQAGKILDVGTGTGLVALMMAQRSSPDTFITALEIDPDAASQAKENVARTDWKNRVAVVEADFRTFSSEERFDLIVSNPPYFVDSLVCPSKQRSMARHNGTLTFEELVDGAARLLAADGMFTVVIPIDAADELKGLASRRGLYPFRQLLVRTRPDANPKRTLISFSFAQGDCVVEELLIEMERHQYSPEYIALTREFYIKM